MTKKIISTLISVSLALALLFGQGSLHHFAFYVMCVMTVLAWLALFTGCVNAETAVEIRSKLWISVPSSLFSLYAMIATNHAVLAASSFLVTMFILILAFRKPEVAA
ncbi:hypothetical protein [Pseudomonas viridiflava]|uniref:hypothetical protein n=1 Tax=Pseudomonas viridiflava TaxID=33069 RepID=UPI000F03B62B|nr:hypothetical protein [Pseudomonas viridiflava]